MPLVSFLALVDDLSEIEPKAKVNRFTRIRNSFIKNYSYIGPGTRVVNTNIGKYCSISWNCCIGLASHGLSHISTSPIFTEINNGTGTSWITSEPQKIEPLRSLIGNDVWIGANAIIIEGLKIGDGAVVGAGAVVTKDVSPYSIVAGVPAIKIGSRFTQDIVQCLLAKKWWNASEDEIKKFILIFQKTNPNFDDIFALPQGFDE
ncbi:antibiotic acetyltransferase [Candidatus Parcubacteria bacterium]|nr:antibiotic acetyltransferase [Candidatus Parcubacteria bacterium]